MSVRPLDPAGPKLGVLLPDFTVETTAGRTIHRREFKGRKHLIICFAPAGAGAAGRGLATAVAALYPAWQAERAETLLVVADPTGIVAAPALLPLVVDSGEQLRARFGVGDEAALFIADRYGEIAFFATATDPTAAHGLPLAEVLPTLGLLEMRCSL